jgi:hypothetical protein
VISHALFPSHSPGRNSESVTGGRLVALSTPFGQRGWFHEEWEGDSPFKKICVTWHDCPRISEAFIQEEIRAMGQA